MSMYSNIIRKNDDHFSFISTFFDLIGNKEFKKAELCTLYSSEDSKSAAFWRSLSAVSELLGSVFHDHVINFIDNVCNVDLCKVKELNSMLSTLGINYSVFDNIKNMPLEVQEYIDILSIKREYLTSYVKLNDKFVTNCLSNICLDDTYMELLSAECSVINKSRAQYKKSDDDYTLVDEISCANCIDDDKFNNFILEECYALLKDKIVQTYNDKEETYIYKNLSNEILISGLYIQNDKIQLINDAKIKYNILVDFDAEVETDNIENGISSISDYLESELNVIKIEQNRRIAPYNESLIKTRYKYYKEKDFLQYVNFIENNYIQDLLSNNYLCSYTYDIDTTYIKLNTRRVDEKSILFEAVNNAEGTYKYIHYKENVLSSVALYLANTIISIRDIRENIKVQCLKNFIYGTKLFLCYIVNEYIRNTIIPNLKNISCLEYDYTYDSDTTEANIVLYVDLTEYSNIQSDNLHLISSYISANNTNQLYWTKTNTETNTDSFAIGSVNTTNIFKKLPTESKPNGLFNFKDISSFYINILKNKFDYEKCSISALTDYLKDFLNTLYSIGAENTFVYDNQVQTYDSPVVYSQLTSLSSESNKHIEILSSNYKVISNDIPDTIDQSLSNTLKTQIYEYYDFLQNSGKELNLKIATMQLSNELELTKEINLYLPLSICVDLITQKLYKRANGLDEQYKRALETDTFSLYMKIENKTSCMYSAYYNISNAYANASSFIPVDYDSSNKTILQLTYEICNMLSSSSLKTEGVKAIIKLSTVIAEENALSLLISLADTADVISTNYNTAILKLSNDLDLIKSDDLYSYRKQLFELYNGNQKYGNTSFYYQNNEVFSSYSLHPYMLNFVEKYVQQNPIENILNIDITDVLYVISENLDYFVDDDGYLTNLHKNPLNTNAEYASRYEYLAGSDSIHNQDTIAYDGFCYKRAFYEFADFERTDEYGKIEKGKLYYVDDNGHVLSEPVDFITALSGIEQIDGSYIYANPWYKSLNLTHADRTFIANQLCIFKNDIQHILKNNYDIFKYGIDILGNSYCLIKEKISDNDYDKQLNAYGSLWIRLKDHPIAFPVCSYKKLNLFTHTYNSYSLVLKENNQFATLLFDPDKYSINTFNYNDSVNYYFKCQDFTLTYDKDIIVINVFKNKITASCPLLATVEKNYNAINDRNIFILNKISIADSLITDAKLSTQFNDYKFNSYFYDTMLIGVVYSKLTSISHDGKYDNSISIIGSYYEFDNQKLIKYLQPTNVDTLNDQKYDILSSNACININNYNLDIAYIEDRPNKLSNYTNLEVNFDDMQLCYYNEELYYDFSIKTKRYIIGNTTFIEETNSEQSYIKYTDIGYYGLSAGKNNLKDSYFSEDMYSDTSVAKFLLISESKTKPIDFRYIVIPARMYENCQKSNVTTPAGSTFEAANLLDVHYFEALYGNKTNILKYSAISAENYIYSPQELLKLCYILDLSNVCQLPYMKVDEEYILSVGKTFENYNNIISDIDKTYTYPWLFVNSTDPTLSTKYIRPYKNSNVGKDKCSFNIFKNDIADISVSWYKYENNIQLDFNSIYNIEAGENNFLSNNVLNCYNLFLNLEKAGDSGYLKIYENPLKGQLDLKAILYIKNLSDAKPKFLISADVIATPQYNVFRTEEGYEENISSFITEDLLSANIINEYIR